MCGICGIIGKTDQASIERMCDAMVHRGPDSMGLHREERVQLGMRRLKVIDLAGADQPISNETGDLHLVCNGEIYNYGSLRKTLEDRGHRFVTQGDVEVILHLYEEYGTDCVKYLDGMFAFAVWDSSNNRLMLARDRLGVKPLYYVKAPNKLIFASEIKAIQASGVIPIHLEESSVVSFTAFPAVPGPMTIFQQVRSLLPGHFLVSVNEQITLKEYWDVDFEKSETELLPPEDAIEVVREKLTQSVSKRLMSDVPLGAFLSGGIDSSAIVGIMGTLLDKPVKTFSIRFSGSASMYEWFDDASFAVKVANAFGAEHTELTVTGREVADNLLRAVWAMDQPSGDAIQYYMVSQCAADEVTVALSGTGGDEVFAGYEWFKEISKIEKIHRLTGFLSDDMAIMLNRKLGKVKRSSELGRLRSRLRSFLAGKKSFRNRYLLNRRLYFGDDYYYLFSPDLIARTVDFGPFWEPQIDTYCNRVKDVHPVNRMSYVQLKSDMVNLLVRDQDAVSMAHSLEVRLPMIDYRLVETAARVPPDYKLFGNREKHVLREAVSHILPEVITGRKKKGFIFPMDDWMRNELKPVVESCLSKGSLEKRGLFNVEAVTWLKDQFYSGKQPFFKVWNLALFELWCRVMVDRKNAWEEPPGELKDYLHE